MRSAQLVLYVALATVLLALVPATIVLLREWRRRRESRRAEVSEDQAVFAMEQLRFVSGDKARADLAARFDAATIERAAVRLLRTAATEQLAASWLRSLGLIERYLEMVRDGDTWGERAHAAEVLGLLSDPRAVTVLIESLRDPHEDVTVKRAASDALGRIRHPSAIAPLVDELLRATPLEVQRIAEVLRQQGQGAVDELVARGLSADRPDARMWSARILGELGDDRACRALIERMSDAHDGARAAAAVAMGKIGDNICVDALVRAAQVDPSPQVRAEAARALGAIADPRAFEPLRQGLEDPDHATRMRALEAMEAMKPDDTTSLERLLRDPLPAVRRRAALALDRVGFVDSCVEAIRSDDPRARDAATEALRELYQAGLEDGILHRARHADGRVREAILSVLAEQPRAKAGPTFLRAANDPLPSVRAVAATGLAKTSADGAERALVGLLSDPSTAVAERASEALRSVAPPKIRPLLPSIHAAFDRVSAESRSHLISVLAESNDQRSEEILVRAADDADAKVRATAVSLLPRLSERMSIRPIVDRVDDPSMDTRLAALGALGRVMSDEARDALLAQLAAPDLRAKEAVAASLANHRISEMRDEIERILASGGTEEQIGLAWTLGKSGDPEAVPYLSRFLRSQEPRLRASAAGALAKIPGKASLDALHTRSSDPDPRTRAAVVNALVAQRDSSSRTVEAVVARTADPDRFVRNRAIIAVAILASERLPGILGADTGGFDRPFVAFAQGLAGDAEGLHAAAQQLDDPPMRKLVLELCNKEPPYLRDRFLKNLNLDAGKNSSPTELSTEDLIARQREILRASGDVERRRGAVAVLAGLTDPAATGTLIDALRSDPADPVRQAAALALARVEGNDRAFYALLDAIADPSPAVCRAAVGGLRGRSDPELSDRLVDRLESSGGELAAALEDALFEIHKAAPTAFVAKVMTSSRRALVVRGLRILERFEGPEIRPALRALLRAESIEIRVAALEAAARIADSDIVELVEHSLGDPSPVVRAAAIDALATTRAPAALPSLLDRVTDPSTEVRTRLGKSLASFSYADCSDIYDALVIDPQPEVRAAALASLLRSASDDGVKRFATLWPRLSADVRSELQRADGREAMIDGLAHMLRWSQSSDVRSSAAIALAAIADPNIDRILADALLDPSEKVREAIVRALSRSTDLEIRQRLRTALDDPSPSVRDVARRWSLRVAK